MNVLIVEDHPLLLRSLESSVLSLRPMANVRGARSIEAASRELLIGGPPEFILLDLGLPDTEGYSGLDHIRKASPNSVIAVVSGSTELDVMRGAFARGACGYLEKTRDQGQFMKAMRILFDVGFYAPPVVADSLQRRPARSSS